MGQTLHFIISRSRSGWAVNLDADRLSDHESVEKARECAASLSDLARQAGEQASVVDLSEPCEA
jgi:hypothetical protein